MKTNKNKSTKENIGNQACGGNSNPTVATVLADVRDNLMDIASEYENQAENMPENLLESCLCGELEEKAEALHQVDEDLENFLATFRATEVDGDGGDSSANNKVGIFEMQIKPPRFIQGSRPKRTGRLIQIIEAVADVVEPRNAEAAETLSGIVSELECL